MYLRFGVFLVKVSSRFKNDIRVTPNFPILISMFWSIYDFQIYPYIAIWIIM